MKDNYRVLFPQPGAFVNFPLDVCKCSDVTQPQEMDVSIEGRMSSEERVGTCCTPNVSEDLGTLWVLPSCSAALLYEYGPMCQQKLKS